MRGFAQPTFQADSQTVRIFFKNLCFVNIWSITAELHVTPWKSIAKTENIYEVLFAF